MFDLDPGEGVMMAQLAEVARAVRDLLADIGLVTFPVTSGSKDCICTHRWMSR